MNLPDTLKDYINAAFSGLWIHDAVGLYVGLWRQDVAAGSAADAQAAVDNLKPAMSALPEPDRRTLIAASPDMQQMLK